MLRFILSAIILFFFSAIDAQDTTITFLNDDWKKTKEEKATFFKKSYLEDGIWTAKFYPLDGPLRMQGYYYKKKTKKGIGLFTYYYQSQTPEKKVEYNKGKRDGSFVSWYESSEKKETGRYIKNRQSGYWTTYYKNGNVDSEGNYVNGKRKGEWNFYFENGNRSAKEKYKPGDENVIGTYWNEDGSLLETGETHQSNPQFKSPYESFEEYVSMKRLYPQSLKDEGIEGTVTIDFLLNKYGEVERAIPANMMQSKLSEEAVKVVLSSPVWVPGKKQNRPVDMWLTVDVPFSL